MALRQRVGALVLALLLVLLLVSGGLLLLTVQPVVTLTSITPPAPVSPQRLEQHVRRLVEELSPRDWQHPENLERAASYIAAQLAAAGGRVSEQRYTAEGNAYINVVAGFGPRDGERIVVGAHYDTHGPLPGADDNASGVAGLIELGRLLGQTSLPLRVDLVGFTLEEQPFYTTPAMGSGVYARALRERDVQVRMMMALEMIGYFCDQPGSQAYPLPAMRLVYPDRGDFIALVGRLGRDWEIRRIKRAMRGTSALPVYSINAPRRLPGVALSDHVSFWKVGYPAVMVTDTAFYRNPHYHTGRDLPETLDYARMAEVVTGVYGAVVTLARR